MGTVIISIVLLLLALAFISMANEYRRKQDIYGAIEALMWELWLLTILVCIILKT